MSADEKPRPKTHRWPKWLGLAFLAALIAVVVFHRPLFFEGTRYFVVRAAKQQKLDLSYKISGSIFTTLEVSHLSARPMEPGPIQRVDIGHIALQYSLWDLLRHGLPAFLKTVEIKDAFVEITPGEFLPPAKDAKPQQFKFPALFPETLEIENVNFLSHGPEGSMEISGLYFTLLPDRPGMLKAQALSIPGVRRWTNISAGTTFRDRDLLLTDLVLGPEINLHRFNLDASEIAENKLGLGLEGRFFGATTALQAQISDLNASNHLDLQASCSGLSLLSLSEYLHLDLPVSGTLANLGITFRGEPAHPGTWTGHINVNLNDLARQSHQLGNAELQCEFKESAAAASASWKMDDANGASITARTSLPRTFGDFAKVSSSGTMAITASDLGTLTVFEPEIITGSVNAEGGWRLAGGRLAADLTLTAKHLGATDGDIDSARFTLHLEKDLSAGPPAFRGLSSRVEGRIERMRIQEYSIDQISLQADTHDAQINIPSLTVIKGGNEIHLDGSGVLPDDMASWRNQPFQANIGIRAPALEDFALAGKEVLKGKLEASGQISGREGMLNGSLAINGQEISTAGLPVKTVDGQLTIANNQLHLARGNLVFDTKNTITATGQMDTSAPHAYNGSLVIQLGDLSIFRPLLGPANQAPELQGSLTANWQGQGNAQDHSGSASLDLAGGRFGDQTNITARFHAAYSPGLIQIPDIRITSNLGSAELAAGWRDRRLSITHLTVRQQRQVVLSGQIDLPLDLAHLQNPDLLLPGNDPLNISLKTDNLDLGALFAQWGQKKPPVTGVVNLLANATGTLDDLSASLALRATGLQSPNAPDLAPAALSLDVSTQSDRLSIRGTLRQSLIQPLEIMGDIPFDPARIKQAGGIDQNTPLNVTVQMPRSSLAFLTSLVPAIRQSRGSAGIDIRIAGTLAQPTLTGRMDASLNVLRFRDPSLPPINDFSLAMNFTQQRIAIERFRGGIAGGSFDLGGSVAFPRLDNPVFDLRLQSRNALVLQNDDITARVNAELRITGPLDAGTLSGNIWITRSSFFKNIDILPIGLPGRPAPQPPGEQTVVSFRHPPLRDWKFDVAIRSQDPFLIQGNMANGQLIFDLRLGGTGLAPWLDGVVNINRLTASLPFSRMEITSSRVYFTRAQPFIPHLDIRGTSTIRDYQVQVNIYGVVTDPQATFTSDPPLPQSDIVSLLATGMTTDEIRRNPDAVAGRAAFLLFQKIYRSVFQRNRPPTESRDSFLSRIQFDIGTTDPKTGKQASSIRIPLSNSIVLVGGLDVGGNFSGQIKYLLRFR